MNEETKNQEPQTVDPAAGTGAFFTKPEVLEAIIQDPPLGDLPPGADGVEPVGARVPRARCERRVEARCDHICDLICQLLAIKCYCARGDADLEALDAAIRWGLKRHRNQVAWLVRKRNGPTIGEAGAEARQPDQTKPECAAEEAQS